MYALRRRAAPQCLDVDLRERAPGGVAEHRAPSGRGDRADRRTVPERIQRVDRVGPEQQPRTDRGAGRGALKHHRLVAGQGHGARGAQAADPGADDDDPLHAS